MTEGYVVFEPAESLYCQGNITYYADDKQWKTTTLWAPWKACIIERKEDGHEALP